jgi:hypothetical protein
MSFSSKHLAFDHPFVYGIRDLTASRNCRPEPWLCTSPCRRHRGGDDDEIPVDPAAAASLVVPAALAHHPPLSSTVPRHELCRGASQAMPHATINQLNSPKYERQVQRGHGEVHWTEHGQGLTRRQREESEGEHERLRSITSDTFFFPNLKDIFPPLSAPKPNSSKN